MPGLSPVTLSKRNFQFPAAFLSSKKIRKNDDSLKCLTVPGLQVIHFNLLGGVYAHVFSDPNLPFEMVLHAEAPHSPEWAARDSKLAQFGHIHFTALSQ